MYKHLPKGTIEYGPKNSFLIGYTGIDFVL